MLYKRFFNHLQESLIRFALLYLRLGINIPIFHYITMHAFSYCFHHHLWNEGDGRNNSFAKSHCLENTVEMVSSYRYIWITFVLVVLHVIPGAQCRRYHQIRFTWFLPEGVYWSCIILTTKTVVLLLTEQTVKKMDLPMDYCASFINHLRMERIHNGPIILVLFPLL